MLSLGVISNRWRILPHPKGPCVSPPNYFPSPLSCSPKYPLLLLLTLKFCFRCFWAPCEFNNNSLWVFFCVSGIFCSALYLSGSFSLLDSFNLKFLGFFCYENFYECFFVFEVVLFLITSINLHLEFLYQKVHISSMLVYNDKRFSDVVVPIYIPNSSALRISLPHILIQCCYLSF